MGVARGKIPKVADAHIVDEVASLWIDRRDARLAIKHVSPLGLLMPMQFAHATAFDPRVAAGDFLETPYSGGGPGPRPAPRRNPCMGVREREAQVRQGALIRRG